MVTLCPAASVPILHGNADVHAPLFESHVAPDGGGSLTTTFDALPGPLFVTTMS